MRGQLSRFTIPSKEIWSCLVEMLLISFKINAIESVMCFLEVIFLDEASSGDFTIAAAEFRITVHTWNEALILGDTIRLLWHWFLSAHVTIMSSVHMVIGPRLRISIGSNRSSVLRRGSPLPLGLCKEVSILRKTRFWFDILSSCWIHFVFLFFIKKYL